MSLSLAQITLVVPDYDDAIAFFCEKLGFNLIEDTPLAPEKRWVVVSPGAGGSALLLAQPKNASESQAVGNASGGRVAFFLESDDFARDYARFKANGVTFLEAPRQEAYGTVAVFADLWGNKWDLIQRRG